MRPINRREFFALSAAGSVLNAAEGQSPKIDEILRAGIARRKIPAVVAAAATENKTHYLGAFGTRDSFKVPVRPDNIFAIASMTKAITTVAALQLVEAGKVDLDEPVSSHLKQLDNLEVLDGFDAAGKPQLRPARTKVTLRHLLTHTSGLCYDTWDEQMFRYAQASNASGKTGPLMYEPGTRWQYGQGIDWAGRLVEAISGQTLEEYFQAKICKPLGMYDTSFILPESKFSRFVSVYRRQPDGVLKQDDRKLPPPPKSYNGGGGLYSTAPDYVRFMQMILQGGRGAANTRLLQEKTVESMQLNQIGDSTAGKMRSFKPPVSSDVDLQPGQPQKWGLGFLITTTPVPGGRSIGSLAWAGIANTHFWIDPKRRICAAILMQFLPFCDKEAVAMLGDFERAVYSTL